MACERRERLLQSTRRFREPAGDSFSFGYPHRIAAISHLGVVAVKKLALMLGVVVIVAGVVGLSQSKVVRESLGEDRNGLKIESGDKNPWTNLKINDDADQFSFAIVSDRTGGHREKVFSKAVHQINLMQPAFVMSVGDLIEGYTLKEDVIAQQWDQFDGFVKQFEMPFFYVPGNHDLTNKTMVAKWGERYGKRYYHFTYKNTLFVSLCSENPPDGMGTIDPEQNNWLQGVLAANKDVRWTFVFLHKPIWTAKDLEKNGWAETERLLAGRNYNVFVGHVHRYQEFKRNGTYYYQLATTGGGSRMRGVEYGEFDMYMWVTVKAKSPVLAVAPLDGLLPANLKLPDTVEPGTVIKKLATFPVMGTVLIDGKPVPQATVAFHKYNETTKAWQQVCDGLTDVNGRFQVTTYTKNDGCPVGEYAVTVRRSGKGVSDDESPEKNQLPERYATPDKTALRAIIGETTNQMRFELLGK
jgi:hypothetical protein